MKFVKLILVNFLFIVLFVGIFESIFGYWFKKNNFGIYIRDQRNIKKNFEVEYNNQKFKYVFERNSLGFVGREVNSEDIKIVFEGGSTGEQMFLPPQFGIVNLINSYFKKDNLEHEIFNASRAGKTLRGYHNDFVYWFPRIDNFKPEIFIFYTGINDSLLNYPKHWDEPKRNSMIEKLEDFVKNNSIIYEFKVKFSNKFSKQIRLKYDLENKSLYNDFKFINYKTASENFKEIDLTSDEKRILENFEKNFNNLSKKIKQTNIKPVFITQVMFNGINNQNLFLINEKLKELCLKNNYAVIKLDEILDNLDKNDFYDSYHPSINGSIKISKIIYPEILKVIEGK